MKKYTERMKEVLAQQVTVYKNVRGNLVRASADDERVILVFDDGRWARFVVEYDYEDHRIELSESSPSVYSLWKGGLLTTPEYKEQAGYEEKYRTARQERGEREQLRRLRAKYGSSKG